MSAGAETLLIQTPKIVGGMAALGVVAGVLASVTTSSSSGMDGAMGVAEVFFLPVTGAFLWAFGMAVLTLASWRSVSRRARRNGIAPAALLVAATAIITVLVMLDDSAAGVQVEVRAAGRVTQVRP